MNNERLLNKPEVLLGKDKIGVQIGAKIHRENGFHFRKIQSSLSTYDYISAHQTNHLKIKNLIWSQGK